MGYWITSYIEDERFYSKEEIEYVMEDHLQDSAIEIFEDWTNERMTATEMLSLCIKYGTDDAIDDIRADIVKWLIDEANITPGRDADVDGVIFRWVEDGRSYY